VSLASTCHQPIDPAEIPRYLDQGYRIMDPHLHTAKSPDVVPAPHVQPRALFDRMIAGGWSFVTFTDHDLMDAYAELPAEDPRLIRGVEIRIRPRRVGTHTRTHTLHVNVYRLNEGQFVELASIAARGDLDAFLDYARAACLPHSLNHPFWHEISEVLNRDVVVSLLRERYFEVIEYNWKRLPEQNAEMLALARLADIPVWGGSDSHQGRPEFATLVRGESFDEAWENVRAGQAVIVQQRLKAGSRHLIAKDRTTVPT